MFCKDFGSTGRKGPGAESIFSMMQAMWEETKKEYGLYIMEEANRAEMLDEAAERMKILGLPEDAISEFQNSGHPSFGMENGQRFPLSNDEKEQIQKLEGNEKYLVYAVIRNDSSFGRMESFVLVSRFKCDWEFERNSIRERNCVMAYVSNLSIPAWSESGFITVRRFPNGTLVRRM